MNRLVELHHRDAVGQHPAHVNRVDDAQVKHALYPDFGGRRQEMTVLGNHVAVTIATRAVQVDVEDAT